MRYKSLIAALTVSTMLSACGGGGGGHGFIPPTTLPDNPDNPSTNACATNSETCMTTQKFSNQEKRIQLYQNAENQATTFSGRRMLKAANNSDSVSEAYNNMHTFLVEGNLDTATDETLLKSLLLAGFSKDELPPSNLEDWVKINSNKIQNKAQTVWDMYGVEKDVSIDNARLNVVNIDARQDSYINFTVDKDGKIQSLHFDVDTNSADSRKMIAQRVSDGKFLDENGIRTTYALNLSGGSELYIEAFEKLSLEQLKKNLTAQLYEQYGQEDASFITKAKAQIDALTENSIANNQDGLVVEGLDKNVTTTITYTSKAKDLNDKKGLQYADFGFVGIESMEGNTEVNETFVVAGGMDAKRISANDLQGKMEFEGTAVAALNHQDETSGPRVETPKNYEGTANLVFDSGKETLRTDFSKDGWYNVVVTSNAQNDNYNIKFEGTPADSMYEFKNTDINNFVGDKGNGSYGAVDIGYYGENKANPSEAAGYVAYGEQLAPGKELHAQIGFGAVKK